MTKLVEDLVSMVDKTKKYTTVNNKEVWLPTEGELCLFWDNSSHEYTCVSKFRRMEGSRFCDNNYDVWDNCSKLIGELPPHLKENQC